jgi:hypothetical protein
MKTLMPETETRIEPIFDFLSETVGWLQGDTAFSDAGRPVAFIRDGSIYAAGSGHYLGRFECGVFRERLGCIVAFTHEACRSTVLPSQSNMVSTGTRRPPSIQTRSVPGRVHQGVPPSILAKPLLNRSSLEWDRFVAGCEAQWPWETRA